MKVSPIDTADRMQQASPISRTDEPDIPLGPEHAGVLMTPEEFDAVEDHDDSYRYELIHGVLIVSPLPSISETGPNEELGRMLLNYREDHPQGKLLDATFPEQHIHTLTSRRRVDRAIWAGLGRPPKIKAETPSIAVEFVSRARRDRRRDYVEKREEYLEAGVVEYWIIDRFHRIMTVFRNTPGGVEQIVIRESETYQTALLPGFELPLAGLLAAGDRAAQSE